MLQILDNLRSHWQGEEITEADILNWANRKVKKMGRSSQAVSFKVKKRVKLNGDYTSFIKNLNLPNFLMVTFF